MVAPLLQTKLFIPPAKPELVLRPRLIERLNAGLHRKLTLISAPAGFGKTTLLSEWTQAMGGATPPIAIAGLSLDESDNDPTRFLTYLIAALQTLALSQVEGIGPRQEPAGNIGQGALSALQSPQPPPTEAVLTALINETATRPDRMILVLDDYHLIDAQPVHDALTFLLRYLPPPTGPGGQCQGVHLVIATREDPPLPLARLRARGQLTELRAVDLRFASSEAAEFLNQVMGLDLSAGDIAALETRTEGWIAGLQLAAISMRGHKDASSLIKSFTGSHRFVMDYLIEEVLEQQSNSVQTFLLQTAILDRLTGSLCDAVTGQDNGQATLEMLEHANLFSVPLDEERRWYRYHHLFADLLRQRLRQTRPEQLPMLHRRASDWHEQNGFADDAIEHALRAEDFERAAYLIEEYVDALWQRGEHSQLRRWLARLPGELVSSRPQLCILHAWYLFASGQQDAAEWGLLAAERALDPSIDGATENLPLEQGQPPGTDSLKLRGRAAAIRAVMDSYRGDVPSIIQHARRALEYLPGQDVTWRCTAAIALGDAYDFKGDMAAAYQARLAASEACRGPDHIYCSMVANLKLAMTLRAQGRLQRTIEICQQQVQLADESGLSQAAVVGCLLAVWGETLAECNDMDGAIQQAKKGVELTERGGNLAMLGWGYLCLTRILYSREDRAGAEAVIQNMENIVREADVPPWIANQMAAWQTRLWLAKGKLDAASQWVQERGLDADGEPTYLHETEYILFARILIAQGRLDEAARLLQRLLEAAEAGGRTTRVIEILLLQALAYQAKDDIDQVFTPLERALSLAEPEGFIRIFVDEGPPMARLLYKAVTRGIAPDYARRLLAAFPIAEPEQTGSSEIQASNSELVEPLSERELEVLRLIAEGLTNPEIASRFFLALNTVKAHTRNIYGKLGVHNRTQAVARARAVGVLPSI